MSKSLKDQLKVLCDVYKDHRTVSVQAGMWTVVIAYKVLENTETTAKIEYNVCARSPDEGINIARKSQVTARGRLTKAKNNLVMEYTKKTPSERLGFTFEMQLEAIKMWALARRPTYETDRFLNIEDLLDRIFDIKECGIGKEKTPIQKTLEEGAEGIVACICKYMD